MAEIKYRARIFKMLLYPEDATHMAAFEIIRSNFQYVAILHDKDTWTEEDEAENPDHKVGTVKKHHYHLLLKFTQARWNTALAAELGIKPNYMQQCHNFDSDATYLVHDGLPDKYQYEPSELEGPLVPRVMKLLADNDEPTRVSQLVRLIQSMGYIQWDELILMACENGFYSDLRRMGYPLSQLVKQHNQEFENGAYSAKMAEYERKRTANKFREFEEFTGTKGPILPLED